MAKLKFYSANRKVWPKLRETCNYNYTEPAANQNFQMAYFCSNCFNYTTHHSSTAFCCPWCAHNYTKVKLSHFRHANWQLPSCWWVRVISMSIISVSMIVMHKLAPQRHGVSKKSEPESSSNEPPTSIVSLERLYYEVGHAQTWSQRTLAVHLMKPQ